METYFIFVPEWGAQNTANPLYYAMLGKSIKRTNQNDPLKLHQNKISAWHAFTRSFVTIGAVGVLWLWTQWQALAYLTLGLSVMLALFASIDYPAKFMKYIFTGQFFGAIVALICTWCLYFRLIIMADDIVNHPSNHQWRCDLFTQ